MDPAGGAYSTPPAPLHGGVGAHFPFPRTPPLWASIFVPLSLILWPFGPYRRRIPLFRFEMRAFLECVFEQLKFKMCQKLWIFALGA